MKQTLVKTALALVMTLLSAPAWAQVVTDEHGHEFATSFDRYNRLQLDVGATSTGEAPVTSFGARYRLAFSADFPDEEIWWRLRHDFGRVRIDRGEPATYRLSLVDADYLRHDVSSWITVPGNSDIRIPGPFDIVVRWELLAISGSVAQPTDIETWEVFELDFLLDFIRDEDYRHRLAVGVTADYEFADGSHELVPLSAATVLYAWESSNGLVALHSEGRLERRVAFDSAGEVRWESGATARAELEWTPIAFNDQPLALFGAAHIDKRFSPDPSEWQVTLGARLCIQ